jgi:hypothetical protein
MTQPVRAFDYDGARNKPSTRKVVLGLGISLDGSLAFHQGIDLMAFSIK